MYSTGCSCQDLNETCILSTDFRKILQSVKFLDNPSAGSQVIPCGRTDMTNLIVAFRSFVNTPPKNALNVQAELLVLVSFRANAGLGGMGIRKRG
jgi:hypothetical protein